MMGAKPILILQLQRMGDLILTFPLILGLQKNYPEHPVWVVAEPHFFTPLQPFSPKVVFFPPSACANMSSQKFFLAINLSSRSEAGQCLSSIDAEIKLGLRSTDSGNYVEGFWHLYRHGLTQNNHLNSFHWADLYHLDLAAQLRVKPHYLRPLPSKNNRVALVVGASELNKHPDAQFWIDLVLQLLKKGYCPVLIGGEKEKEFGTFIASKAHQPAANLCGKLSLKNVAMLFRETALCITPDTGPMHLADWMGARILNLSMGQVHAAETGPFSPQQWILRANVGCIGCWQCVQRSHLCKKKFHARDVVQIAEALLEPDVHTPRSPSGLQLLKTGRDAWGLFRIFDPVAVNGNCRTLLENFWRAAFMYFDGQNTKENVKEQFAVLCESFPRLAEQFAVALQKIVLAYTMAYKKKSAMPDSFWHGTPKFIRLFAGQTHMFLQNANWSADAWRIVMERLAILAECQTK